MFFKGRKKRNIKTRATLGGLAIAVTALYALTVSYDITIRELAGYLLGSVVVLVGAMLAAVAVVLIVSGFRWCLRQLLKKFSGGHE